MTTRFIDHLLTGDHASLPAANAVPQGTLYSCTDHAKIYQSDGSAAWSDWATITGAAPGAHASSHEDGGGDEIDVTGLSGLLADPQTPDSHTHPQSEVTDLVTDLAAKAALAGATFTGDISVPDEAYDATNWDGNLEVPTKNAIRDKIETLGGGYTDEQAQDAVGAMVDDATLEYVDATPALHVKDAGITPAKASTALKTFQIIVTIGDGVNVISTGFAGDLPVKINGTITDWDLFSDASGSIVIDSWKDTYANFPPTVADTMWGTKPSLSATDKNQATGLSIAIAVGDVIRFNVDSATTIKQITLSFSGVRT